MEFPVCVNFLLVFFGCCGDLKTPFFMSSAPGLGEHYSFCFSITDFLYVDFEVVELSL